MKPDLSLRRGGRAAATCSPGATIGGSPVVFGGCSNPNTDSFFGSNPATAGLQVNVGA